MALKIRRHSRYEKLRKDGFLPFEARPLSRVPSYVPYLKAMARERRDMIKKARALGTTQRQFEAQIKELYQINKWLRKNKAGKTIASPWAMFRDYGDRFRQKHPEYDSPWQKRQRRLRDFEARIERTLKRQGL
jgi:hypothetical protein